MWPGALSFKAPGWLQCSPYPCCPDVELDLQRSVQAVLRELSAQAPALQSNQGKSQPAAPAPASSFSPTSPIPLANRVPLDPLGPHDFQKRGLMC